MLLPMQDFSAEMKTFRWWNFSFPAWTSFSLDFSVT